MDRCAETDDPGWMIDPAGNAVAVIHEQAAVTVSA